MAAQPVEWVLVIYYGPSAHRATYGRLVGTQYTKDYIQLSRKAEFLEAVERIFPVAIGREGTVPLTYKWPTGTTPGAFVFHSADRPHLKWETSQGAPKAWKMSLAPNDAVAETIPGDPTHVDFAAAESELASLATRGAGQPYLIAVKLHDESSTLHLRAYLDGPSATYAWADLDLVPPPIRTLAARTSQRSALAWEIFASGGAVPSVSVEQALSALESSGDPASTLNGFGADAARGLSAYLRRPGYGLFFDPARNHDAWILPAPLSQDLASSVDDFLNVLDERFPAVAQSDAAAEASEPDPRETEGFRKQIEDRNYNVEDSIATIKTRGSAQRAFADEVKSNYGYRCAITGIETKSFLVASHIVPWSEDQSIRLDPCNGICLSLLVDRAFEKGYLIIDDDLTIRIDSSKVGEDLVLCRHLEPYHGQKMRVPPQGAPLPIYLQRRRALVAPND